MSAFYTKLNAKVSKHWEGDTFTRTCELQKPLHYKSDILGKIVVIPKGFVSDGASVPRLLWTIYPPFGQYLEAAIVHDYYCVLGHKGESPIDYKVAADVFKEAMQVCKVSWWRRNKMYWAVRIGGPKFKAKNK